jgi:hypothetical protein
MKVEILVVREKLASVWGEMLQTLVREDPMVDVLEKEWDENSKKG